MSMQLQAHQYESIISKFILNLSREELDDPCRLSFHAEKAFYYYLDVVAKCKETDWKKQRQDFFHHLQKHSVSFLKINPTLLSDKLLESKPVCGAIIFNKENTKVLVIKVGDKHGFPKGKQNQGQTLADCATREVEEETGINIVSKIDSRIRIDFSNHEGRLFFFVARGVAEEERIKVDKSQVDEVLWMPIEKVRKDITSKFAERSKIAWTIYERDFGGRANNQQYAPKYFKKDNEEIDYKEDPLRSFKLDREKLDKIFETKPKVPNTFEKKSKAANAKK